MQKNELELGRVKTQRKNFRFCSLLLISASFFVQEMPSFTVFIWSKRISSGADVDYYRVTGTKKENVT